MGFSKAQSEVAIRNNETVQAALEAILMYSDADKCRRFGHLVTVSWTFLIVLLVLANESCSDMDNNELDYNENDSENGEDHCKFLWNF